MGAADKVDAIEVHGFPVMACDAEVELLLASYPVNHQSTPALQILIHPEPHQFSYPGGRRTHENPGGDLQQPSCEMAAKAGWACREHKNYHGTSSSLKL